MEGIVVPVLFGLLVEAVVFYVDELAVKRNYDWRLVAALVAAIASTVAFEIDIFAESGFVSQLPFVGAVFTGILFSRVANFAHNTIGMVESVKDAREAEAQETKENLQAPPDAA